MRVQLHNMFFFGGRRYRPGVHDIPDLTKEQVPPKAKVLPDEVPAEVEAEDKKGSEGAGPSDDPKKPTGKVNL